MATTEELKEVIASFVTNSGEVEIARISHPAITTRYFTNQLSDSTLLVDEGGSQYSVEFANMSLSDESGGALLLNERQFSLQGVNDLIATEEDKIIAYQDTVEANLPPNERAKVSVDILSYVAKNDGTISTVAQGPYKYFNQKTTYAQRNNTATLQITTTPTNNSETGVLATTTLFPTLAGFL